MTIQHIHKNTIRQRKSSEWFQGSRNSEKPEKDTKIKILKFQENYNKPSPTQGLEQYYKVTPCNEKCNFFILLSFVLLKSITLIQFLFVGTGSPRPNLRSNGIFPFVQNIENGTYKESFKYMIYGIYSNTMSKWIDKKFYIHTIPIQWMRRIEKDTKFIPTFIIGANSCNLKKVAINTV